MSKTLMDLCLAAGGGQGPVRLLVGLLVEWGGRWHLCVEAPEGHVSPGLLLAGGVLLGRTSDEEWDVEVYLLGDSHFSLSYFNGPADGTVSRLRVVLEGEA